MSALVERMIADGVDLAVEVGPQQVLTRLTRQIRRSAVDGTFDRSSENVATAYQLLSARAGLEVMIHRNVQEHATLPTLPTAPAQVRQTAPAQLHFDATAVRRERMRQSAPPSSSC